MSSDESWDESQDGWTASPAETGHSAPVDDSEPPEGAEPEPAEPEPGPESNLGRYLVLATAGLSAAALIVAAVFGIQWWVAAGNDNLALAQAREQVVRDGGVAVKAYTELDYTNPDAYFQKVLAVSTSDMQNLMKNSEQSYRQSMTDAKTKVTTTVQDIGVEELDDHGGKASFLAAVSTLVTVGTQQPVAKPLRLEVQMTRVGQDWKVSGISSVPLVSSGQ
jgi:Mce-associated membrane protein